MILRVCFVARRVWGVRSRGWMRWVGCVGFEGGRCGYWGLGGGIILTMPSGILARLWKLQLHPSSAGPRNHLDAAASFQSVPFPLHSTLDLHSINSIEHKYKP